MSADVAVDKEGCDLYEWCLYFILETIPPSHPFYEVGLSILFWRLYGLANKVPEERNSRDALSKAGGWGLF